MATIEIDGKTLEVENGKMIIEVADEAGIQIPRFCYHKKLSVAANCRMCLVEIHNSKKTVPACATPINDGMKVFTQSEAALKSQQAVMEFLLINHPLDCPICDQGGECELQDVSMGFGSDHSDYLESKRSVDDKSLGSLISTEMTRCIHCTRCVRFGEEIAGLREMGAPFRGEDVKIGTYVESAIKSEVSGNIIDLCPVGALTSKPYRYTARSWELTQTPGIAVHDCLGSHIYLHSRRGRVMRVIPREEESINETWLSDRDRFSYTGLYTEQRLAQPMMKQNGKWQTVDWSQALNYTATKLGEVLAHHGPQELAAFASASASVEELYLLQKWLRSLKVENMDFRLQQNDYSDQAYAFGPHHPVMVYADLENASQIILFGTQVQREVPLAATRIRKAYLNGASIASINYARFAYPFEVTEDLCVSPDLFVEELIAIALALKIKDEQLPLEFQELLEARKPSRAHKNIAKMLGQDEAVLVTGAIFENHPQYAQLRAILSLIVEKTKAKWLHLSQGANASGAWASRFIPGLNGKNTKQSLESKLKGYILHGVEPDKDFFNPKLAIEAMKAAEFVVAVTSFKSESLLELADVLLPMSSLGESSGTFVNLNYQWQSMEGCVPPYEQSRPAWKIYRVLANLSHCQGFDYVSSAEIREEARVNQSQTLCSKADVIQSLPRALNPSSEAVLKVAETALYSSDMLVRAAKPLQESAAADRQVLKLNSKTAEKCQLGDSEEVTIHQDGQKIKFLLERDEGIADNIVLISAIGQAWSQLGGNYEQVSLN